MRSRISRTRVPHELELVEDLVPLMIQSGQKRATIRYGLTFIDAAQIQIKPAKNRLPAGNPFEIDLEGIDIVSFGKINQHPVDLESGGTAKGLKNGLQGFYRNIPDDYPVTIIRFKYPGGKD